MTDTKNFRYSRRPPGHAVPLAFPVTLKLYRVPIRITKNKSESKVWETRHGRSDRHGMANALPVEPGVLGRDTGRVVGAKSGGPGAFHRANAGAYSQQPPELAGTPGAGLGAGHFQDSERCAK